MNNKAAFFIIVMLVLTGSIIVVHLEYPNFLMNAKKSSGDYLLDNSKLTPSATEAETNNFDFQSLNSFLNRMRTELESYPLVKGGEGYINATFYGVMAQILLGGADDIVKADLERFLIYTYNEDDGGFREWLGGEETIEATVLGFLIKKVLNLNLTEFSDSRTRVFVINNIENAESLYQKALALILLNELGGDLTVQENLANAIVNQLLTGDFSIRDAYWAYSALEKYNSSLLTDSVKNKIKEIVLGSYVEGYGFGTPEPNIFETGLSLELLVKLGYENDTLFNDVLEIINASQELDGGVKQYLNSSVKNVFSAFGAVLAFYATGRLTNLIKVNHQVEPSQQIPIDYNYSIIFRFDVENYFEDIEYLKGEYNITTIAYTGSFEYASEFGYEVILPKNASELGFGNHTVDVSFYFDLPTIHKVDKKYSFSFRVGYNITLYLEDDYPPINSSLGIKVNITFYNGTFVNEGMLYLKISHELGYEAIMIFNLTEENGKVITTYNISEQPLLGVYKLEVYVNDTHGWNHTVAQSKFTVLDSLNITVLSDNGNRTLGSKLIIKLNVTYSTTGLPVMSGYNGNNASLEMFFDLGKEFVFDECKWLANGTIIAVTNIFNVVPDDLTVPINLKISWDSFTNSSYEVMTIQISLEDLRVEFTKLENIMDLGVTINISLKLFAQISGANIENATLQFSLANDSELVYNVSLEYNRTISQYTGEFYADADMIEGTYKPIVVLKYGSETAKIPAVNEVAIHVRGYPQLGSYKVIKSDIDEPILVKFTVVRNGSKALLKGLSTKIIIKKDNESFVNTTAEDLQNGTYIFGFIAEGTGTYTVLIYRSKDMLFVGSLEINVTKGESKFVSTLQQYAPSILIGVLISALVIYVGVSYYFSKKIPRRYLKERLKKGSLTH